MEYNEFIEKKVSSGSDGGFDPLFVPDFLFDFQRHAVESAIRRGRLALFEDCGLGKTIQQLVWAQNVYLHTGKPVIVFTPVAVAEQTTAEAHRFGIDAEHSRTGKFSAPIVITNYEQIDKFDPSKFGGCVLDESSILKNYDGKRKGQITEFMLKIPYRLLATATAAPNDFVELGTSSEALGYMGHMDMLNRFFKNDLGNSATGRVYGEAIKWRLKGHAEEPFWRWVCSWALAIRKPSDIGFDDGKFILPALTETTHEIDTDFSPDGFLFSVPAQGLAEQREDRRNTIKERCEKIAELADTGQPALVWCHLNEEGDMLEKMIQGAKQVSGKDAEKPKTEKLLGFANGEFRVLITKPKIGAWGLNYQHCNHVLFFPSHSYEQYYQGVRRCWRFGQKRDVTVDIVTTPGEQSVIKNMQRKAKQADEMFANLVAQMNNALSIERANNFTTEQEIPSWL